MMYVPLIPRGNMVFLISNDYSVHCCVVKLLRPHMVSTVKLTPDFMCMHRKVYIACTCTHIEVLSEYACRKYKIIPSF